MNLRSVTPAVRTLADPRDESQHVFARALAALPMKSDDVAFAFGYGKPTRRWAFDALCTIPHKLPLELQFILGELLLRAGRDRPLCYKLADLIYRAATVALLTDLTRRRTDAESRLGSMDVATRRKLCAMFIKQMYVNAANRNGTTVEEYIAFLDSIGPMI